MNVRSFQLSDYKALTELLEEVLTTECYELTMEAFARQLSWDSDLVLVAVKESEIVGMIIGTIDNNKGYYYRIAVSPSHQRSGVGRALVTALRQRFEQRNVMKILITADEHNEPVLPLYQAMGFDSTDFFRSFQKLSIVNG